MIFFVLVGCMMTSTAFSIHLPIPDLSGNAVLKYDAGLRPHRKGGLRIELEKIQDKYIIHNYGYGGAGFSLSWGGAQDVLKIVKTIPPIQNNSIAILGAGIIGLSTAYILQKAGYSVTVYAENFQPNITSNVAGGIWYPYGVDVKPTAQARTVFEEQQRFSYNFLKTIATSEVPIFRGVSLIDCYRFSTDPLNLDFLAPELRWKENVVSIDNAKDPAFQKAFHHKNILMNVPEYLESISNVVKQQGAIIKQQALRSLNDILKKKETIIINCLGLGARTIFNDKNLIPVRGQTVRLVNSSHVNYLVSSAHVGPSGTFFMLIGRPGDIFINGTYEKGEERCVHEPNICEELLNNAREFYSHFNS